jgi:hypothetical protein
MFIGCSCNSWRDWFKSPNQIIIKGEKGDKGETGVKGEQGIPGKSIKGDKGDRGEAGYIRINRIIYSGSAPKRKIISIPCSPFYKDFFGQHYVELCIYNMNTNFDDFNNYIFYSADGKIKATGALQGNSCLSMKVWTDKNGNITWKSNWDGTVIIELEGYYPN